MGSKLAWFVVLLGGLVAYGSIRGTLWPALQAYASGGQVDVVKGLRPLAQQITQQPATSGNTTVILTQPVGGQPPAGTGVAQ